MSQFQSIVPQSDLFIPMLRKLPLESYPAIATDLHRKMYLLRWQQNLLLDGISMGHGDSRFLQEMLEHVSKDLINACVIVGSMRSQLPNDFQALGFPVGVDKYRLGVNVQYENQTRNMGDIGLLLSLHYGCNFRLVKTAKNGTGTWDCVFEGIPVFATPEIAQGATDIMKHINPGRTFHVGHPGKVEDPA